MTDRRQRVAPRQPAEGRGPSERERVLARRRMALIVLAVLVPVTLVAAIITGSILLLAVNLVADLLIALYVAMLLQIKQAQGDPGQPPAPRGPARGDARPAGR